MLSYAQVLEDVLLFRVLKDVKEGFYIDVGSHDPGTGSVSRLFYDLGWRGINIEPSRVWFEKLAAHRSRDVNLNVAVLDQAGDVDFYEIEDTGLSTTVERHARRHSEKGFTRKTYPVRAETLAAICEQHAPAEIHFLKIDVQGAEGAVLRGGDFARFRPWVVLLEAKEPLSDTPSYQDWEPILTAHNYQFVSFDGLNRFYLSQDHMDLVPLFSAGADDYERAAFARQREDLQREAALATKRANSLERQLIKKEAHIQAMESSLAWRMTAPVVSVLHPAARRFSETAASVKKLAGFGQQAKISSLLSDRFSYVYSNNEWGDAESVSGAGSRRDSGSVVHAINALRATISKHSIRSINDIPCGDFNWMGQILEEFRDVKYNGFDIVQPLIEKNKQAHPRYNFSVFDITSSVPPQADLIFCKDLLNHLTYEDVVRAIANMKASKSRYLLASNNFGYPNTELSKNAGGASRHLDITARPLFFAEPIWGDGYLGFWSLPDLQIPALKTVIDTDENKLPM